MYKEKSIASLTLAANAKAKEKSYWLNLLAGQPPRSSFPIDEANDRSGADCLEHINVQLPKEINQRLMALSKGSDARLFIFLLAGVFVLLKKYSGNKDLVLGIPVSHSLGNDGLLNSALAIRCLFEEDTQTFPQLLTKIRQTLVEAEEHQNFPIEVIADLLGLDRSPGEGFPLFDVGVSFRNIHQDSLSAFSPGVLVSFERDNVGLHCRFGYHPGKYTAETITRLTGHYLRLMETMLTNPHESVFRIPLLSDEEEHHIMVSFNETDAEFPESTAVHHMVDRQAQHTPGVDAIVYKEQRLTYRELYDKTNLLASLLRQKGVGPDSIVAVLFDHTPEMVVALLGILKAGAAYLPIAPDLPAGRIQYIIDDSQALYIVASEKYAAGIRQYGDRVLSGPHMWETAAQVLENSDTAGHDPRSLAYIMYTSGSTGRPKGVMIEHRSFTDFTTWAVETFEHCSGYQVLLSNSYASDGAVQQIFPPLVSGGTLHLIDKELRLDVVRYTEYLKRHRINNIDEVPVLMNELLDRIDPGDSEEKLPDLTNLCLGSEYVPIEIVRKCRKHLNHNGKIINAYGPAEASVETTTYYFDGRSEEESSLIGKPRRNIRVYILDEHGQCCPLGVKGEICISGVGLARGYLNRPQLTAEKFILNSHSDIPGDHLYKTGDQGCWLPDGNLRFFGRLDNQIQIRGHRVELSEIQQVIKKHEGITDAIVLPRTNPKDETEIYAYYVDDTRRRPVVWPSIGEYPLYDEYVYYAMTGDEVRNDAYKAAIRQKVVDKVVVEIGTGKDVILAQFCVEAGAKIVYAIEISENSYKQAQQTVNQLGLQDKIILIQGDAADVDIPEKADVCLSEVIGTIGGSEGTAAILKNARRFLKDGGEMIPDRCITKIAAVQLPTGINQSPSFSQISAGYVEKLYNYFGFPFDFRVCIDNFPVSSVISTDGVFEVLDFSGEIQTQGQENIEIQIVKDGRMDGFILWLNLFTAPGEMIDTLNNRHCWAPVFVPVMYPGELVSKNDKIRMSCKWSLSRNGINPDYSLEGVLVRKDGEDISFRHQLPYFETQFLANPFHRQLLTDNPGAYARNVFQDLDITQMRDYLEQHLPSYMLPSHLVELEKIPMTPNGKVDKDALPEPETSPAGEYVAPRDDLEKTLTTIWAGVLDRDEKAIGIHGNFFKIGGHSLKAAVLASRIQKQLKIDVPLIQVFKTPTISGLAEYVKGAGKSEYFSIEPVELKEYYPLTPVQKRLHFLQRMDDTSTAYNVPGTIVLENPVSRDQLEKIFNIIIQRHEILRTSIQVIGEESRQCIHDHVSLEIECLDPGIAPDCGDRTNLDIKSLVKHFVKPFDLKVAPLLRAGFINIENKQVLAIDMHHIICDPISHSVLASEFKTLLSGRQLPPLKLQYRDYAGWQNSSTQQQKVRQQETYWTRLYSDDMPVLDLLTDFPRPQVQSFAGASMYFKLDDDVTPRIQQVADTGDVTLFMLILAVFNVLLAKLSGQEDIIVGTPVSSRQHEGIEKMIGMFVNTLALRSYPEGQKQFNEFLQEIKLHTLAAYKNADYPFEELVDKIALRRDVSRNPLFDVIFNYLKESKLPGEESPIKKEMLNTHTARTSKFDIGLTALDYGDDLLFNIEYCTRLFKADTIDRIVGYFKRIMVAVLEDPYRYISGIQIVTDEGKEQVLFKFNDSHRQYPKRKSIHLLFEEQVVKTPNHPAVVGPALADVLSGTGKDSFQSLSYHELNQMSGRMQHLLREKGVEPGTIVSIKVERSIEMIAMVLAILKSGAAYLPIDPDYPEARIKYMMADSAVGVLITSEDIARLVVSEDTGFDSSADPVVGQEYQYNLAYVIYTSGSTGNPKGVMVEHHNVTRLVKNTNYIQFEAGDRLLKTGALEFDASTFEIWGALLNGLTLYLTAKENILNPVKLKQIISDKHITTMWLTSPLFNQMVQSDITIFSGLKKLLVGGDILSTVHIEQVRKQFEDLDIINGYGPTENTTFSTTHLIRREYKEKIPIGRPIANSTAYIVDKTGGIQPVGVVGELWVGGDGVSRGYMNNPETTADKFTTADPSWCIGKGTIDRIYKTGDLGRWLPDGNIEFLGRIDQQVKIRGFRIELGEIENLLQEFPGIIKSLVIDQTDTDLDEKYLCAYIVVDHEIPAQDIRHHLSQQLPDYMIPSYFVFIDTIPLTPNGKIHRSDLPLPDFGSQGEIIAPRNKNEKKLVEIWAAVLKIEKQKIGIDSDFFELSGHSLNAVKIIDKIHSECNTKISIMELFKYLTIRKLATHIKDVDTKVRLSLEKAAVQNYYPLSPAQSRMYFIDLMNPGNTINNVPSIFMLAGDLDKPGLEDSFRKMIQRHEILRTSYLMLGEGAVQKIHPHAHLDIQYIDSTGPDRTQEIVKHFIRPFDLSQVPILRVGLVKESETRHVLIVDMHHISTDLISKMIFIEEFIALYSGLDLPPLAFQYKDFSQWQNRLVEEGAIRDQENYWLERFKGDIPVLNLPTDFPRPDEGISNEGLVYSFVIDEELTRRIKELLAQTQTTMYMFLLAAYNVLLSLYSNQEDIVVGSPVTGRRTNDLQNIIGMFINMLPMRNRPGKKINFLEFLEEIKVNALNAFENQDYQFDQLIKKLEIRGENSRNPLVEVVLNVLSTDAAEKKNHSIADMLLKVSQYKDSNSMRLPFELIFTAVEKLEQVHIEISYVTALFKTARIEKMAGHFIDIIHKVLDENYIMLQDISLPYGLAELKTVIPLEEDGDFEF
jgi:amino acid adenylation domain-containing protein